MAHAGYVPDPYYGHEYSLLRHQENMETLTKAYIALKFLKFQ